MRVSSCAVLFLCPEMFVAYQTFIRREIINTEKKKQIRKTRFCEVSKKQKCGNNKPIKATPRIMFEGVDVLIIKITRNVNNFDFGFRGAYNYLKSKKKQGRDESLTGS